VECLAERGAAGASGGAECLRVEETAVVGFGEGLPERVARNCSRQVSEGLGK
jgi:hypothetical protein